MNALALGLALLSASPTHARGQAWESTRTDPPAPILAAEPRGASPDAERETLSEQLEAVRRRLDALERAGALPDQLAARSARGVDGTGAPAAQADSLGEEPEEERIPEIPSLDGGGSLLRGSRWTLEPAIEFVNSSRKVAEFSGVLVDPVLLGRLDISSVERDSMTSSLKLRWALGDRFEASLRVPFVVRSDRRSSIGATNQDSAETQLESLRGRGLGDAELGLHYRMGALWDGGPLLSANLSLGAPTGSGPFDDPDDENRLATGSGSWSVEPSLTAVWLRDPAVLYGTLFFTYNAEARVDRSSAALRDPDRATMDAFEPGHAFGGSLGFGVALNERTSFNLGYSHRYVLASHSSLRTCERPAESDVEAQCRPVYYGFESDPYHVGELQLGLSYQHSPRTSYQFTLSVGVTESAPDVRVSLRTPLALGTRD